MTAAKEFMEHYRAAFARGDANALAECFEFPLQVIGVADDRASVSVVERDAWPQVIRGLIVSYERLEVADVIALAMDVNVPMVGVAVVRAHWGLQRQDGDAVYEFTAAYTLAQIDEELRIVAIAHNELPKLQTALRALRPLTARPKFPRVR